MCNIGHKQSKDHDKSELVRFLPKNSSTTSHKNKNMESAKRITRREAKEIVDSVLGNNRTFHWKFSLLRIIIFDDILKEHMETLSGR